MGEIDALGDAFVGVRTEVDKRGRWRGRRLLAKGVCEGLGLGRLQHDAREGGKSRESQQESAAREHQCGPPWAGTYRCGGGEAESELARFRVTDGDGFAH